LRRVLARIGLLLRRVSGVTWLRNTWLRVAAWVLGCSTTGAWVAWGNLEATRRLLGWVTLRGVLSRVGWLLGRVVLGRILRLRRITGRGIASGRVASGRISSRGVLRLRI
jgi:hypothetical protein